MSEEALASFPNLSKHHSFMKQHLSRELYAKYYGQKTANGVTLDHCIQTGIDDPSLDVGMVAGDAESYTKFKEVFYPVVKSYHNGYDPYKDTHPLPDTLDPEALPDTPLDDKYIISSRMRIGRSIGNFAFSPSCTRAQRRAVESIAKKVLEGLTGELKGKYHPVSGMTKEEEEKLVSDHFLFAKPASDFMRNAGMGRDWSDARGIYYNPEKSFLVWVNEEDHLRIISMQKGADFKTVFKRFCNGVNQIRKQLNALGHGFQCSPQLGYVCTCPTNLGTSLRCSVHIKLTNLCQDKRFNDIVKKLRLDKRGTAGEYRASAGPDIFDLSNLDRLGKTESELVQLVYNAIKLLIQMEKRLEAGKSIDDLVP